MVLSVVLPLNHVTIAVVGNCSAVPEAVVTSASALSEPLITTLVTEAGLTLTFTVTVLFTPVAKEPLTVPVTSKLRPCAECNVAS